MPLTLRGIEDFHLAHHGKRYENAFCALMAQWNKTCAACLNDQQKTLDPTTAKTRTVMCFANLYESVVPLRVGGDLLGFLQTGEGELKEAEKTWFQTKVLSHKQYESVLRLLEIFALHLGIVGNQLVIQRDHAEPPSITRARQFIADHRREELTLATVAKAVNMSSYYFCKTFKKVSGLNFTDYLRAC